MSALGPDAPCPCGRPASFGACCGPILADERPAPTAEALMRSRYSAFVVGDAVHLLRSWHPDTRPRRLHLGDGDAWERLDVLATTGGGLLDQEGTVRFEAHRVGQEPLGEHSRFVRHDGRWVYVGPVP